MASVESISSTKDQCKNVQKSNVLVEEWSVINVVFVHIQPSSKEIWKGIYGFIQKKNLFSVLFVQSDLHKMEI